MDFEEIFNVEYDFFIKNIYQIKPYYTKVNRANIITNLISWDKINKLLVKYRYDLPQLRFIREKADLTFQYALEYTTNSRGYPRPIPNLRSLNCTKALEEGATLVINSINEPIEEINTFCMFLEKFFLRNIRANLYATKSSTEAFGIHWDLHDVIVIQVHGTKNWKVYCPTKTYPMPNDLGKLDLPKGEPYLDIILNPGDILYLPKGWWHNVISDNESLHLSFSFPERTNLDLLDCLKEKCSFKENFRKDILSRIDVNKSSNELNELKIHLKSIVDQITLDDIYHFVDKTNKIVSYPSLGINQDSPNILFSKNWRFKPHVSFSNSIKKYKFYLNEEKVLVDLDPNIIFNLFDKKNYLTREELFTYLKKEYNCTEVVDAFIDTLYEYGVIRAILDNS